MKKASLILVAMLALSACESPTAARPDNRVGVLTDPQTGKMIAVARTCPAWNESITAGLENHAQPEFGCADYYNLAHMIDRPSDLIEGRKPGSADTDRGVLGVERYREDKTKQLINPKEIPATN